MLIELINQTLISQKRESLDKLPKQQDTSVTKIKGERGACPLCVGGLLSVCFICSVPLALKGSQCKLIQDTVLNTLLGDQPDYVASFGNSDVNSVGDWVKIINNRPANEVW